MKEEFANYLKSISMSDILINRVEGVLNFYQSIYPDEVQDIFISEFIKDDGTREYESLWLFSPRLAMEAKEFVTRDDYDAAALTDVIHWEIKKKDYDFEQATEQSRLFVSFSTQARVSGDLKGSRENCAFLKNTFLKYIAANLINK
jgi:hypothetical protein